MPTKTTSPSPFPAFMRRMTPDKYKAMSTADQIAYRKKADAWMAAFDARIDARNAADDKQLASGIAELIKNNRHLESEIVQSYIRREGKYLVDRAFFDANPRFDEAYAQWDLQQLKRRRAGKPGQSKARGKRSAAGTAKSQ